METHFDVEPVTVSDVLGLSSWDRERSSDELQGFLSSKHHDFSEIYESIC